MFALLLALSLSGSVYTPNGNVVPGARVEARVPVTGPSLASTTTSSDGRFTFNDLPDGVIEIVATVEGLPEQTALTLAGDSDVTVTMAGGSPPVREGTRDGEGTIKGIVRLDGKPLPRAPVVLHGLEEGEEVRVVANEKGEFLADKLEAQSYAVSIDERLRARVRAKEPAVVDLQTAQAAHTIDLVSAPRIRGRVVDADGKPVSSAGVHLIMANRPVIDFLNVIGSRTSSDGRYSLAAPEWDENDEVAVAVTAPRQSTVRSKTFAFGTGEHTIDVKLPKLETVKVRVSDRAGKPLPKALVAFTSTNDTATFDTPLLLLSMPFVSRAEHADENGEVSLRLAPDTYDFAFTAEGFQSTTLLNKSLGRATTIDVVLERAATLRGRVHREGKGVGDVRVMLAGVRSRSDGTDKMTASDGTFSIDGLAPGTYRLHLFKAEELIERTVEAEAPGTVEVALPPAGTLHARVLDAATKEPVREFAFSVEPLVRDAGSRAAPSIHRGEQSADGTFSVTVPVGTYRVSAGAIGFVTADPIEVRVTDREPARVDIPLGRGITIAGRVIDDGGMPIADANVMIMDPDEQQQQRATQRQRMRVAPANTRTSLDGTFTLTGVTAGEAGLFVRKDGYVPYRQRILAEESPSLDIRLTRGLTLRGLVTRDGKPVDGAQISASTAAVGGDQQSAMTDDEGRFVLSGLIAARYTVSAFRDEMHAEVSNVDPAKQKEIAITLDPKPRGVVYGTVSGIPPAQGGKYVRRMVVVQGTDAGTEGMIDETGNYRIENAPLGSVQVSAFVETSARTTRSSAQKRVEVIAGQPLRVDLDLGGDVRVSGRITHEGKPVAGTHVGFTNVEGMTSSSTMTRDDGTYDIALPLPGRYHIYARAEQLSDRHFQTVREVRNGDTVDIDLREQVIEGMVVDAATRLPIEGAIVTLAPAAGAVMAIATEVPTDANGRFRIVTATTGAYRLIVTAPGYAHRMVPMDARQIELAPAAELRVRVLDARSGAPLDAYIVIRDRDGAVIPVRAQRSADGATFAFSLAPGRYQLEAIVNGYAAKRVEATAPGTVDVTLE